MAKTYNANYSTLLRGTFREASMFLRAKLMFEKQANQYNFDSGIPLEDYFRQTFGRFIPESFAVCNGTVVDHQLFTCGDCDFIVYSPCHAPLLKLPATDQSRRKILSFESTYGIIEVKQSLTLESLGDACAKIHDYKSLVRPPAQNGIPGVLPPFPGDGPPYNVPFGVAFFYESRLPLVTDQEADGFLAEVWGIESQVPRAQRVNGLYVLNRFSVNWVRQQNAAGEPPHVIVRPEHAPEPTLSFTRCRRETLYLMFADLWDMLLAMQLKPPHLLQQYGGQPYLQNFPSRVESFDEPDAANG